MQYQHKMKLITKGLLLVTSNMPTLPIKFTPTDGEYIELPPNP
ncbi:hypothetical protein IFVP182_C260230 [Vibrio parahaemolyticus]|nr:hypothetical protein [Vibrio alginolyticus]